MDISDLEKEIENKIKTLGGEVALHVNLLNENNTIAHNEDHQFWAASTIKVLIALAFYKKFDKEKLNQRVKINQNNYVLGSGVVKLLDKDTKLTYEDLITLMLVVSDNTAANELIDQLGSDFIEEYAKEIGMPKTTFRHKMMIKAGKGPNLTTAKDMSVMLRKLYLKELPGAENVLEMMSEQLDRTRAALFLPSKTKASLKYGNLSKAVHEVGIVFAENPFTFCFFSDDQEDKNLTKEILSQCAKLCFDYSTNSSSSKRHNSS